MVGTFRQKPHLLESEADVTADVFPFVKRCDVGVAAVIHRPGRRQAVFLCLEKVKLTFGSNSAEKPHACGAFHRLF